MKTKYEAPLLYVEKASLEAGFAQSGKFSINQWDEEDESDSVNF